MLPMKRFTESTKWDDPWFRQISPAAKLLFLWMVDKCDGAGIIDVDLGLAAFQIGTKINEETLEALGDRVVQLENGKFILAKFIPFQHGELSRDCKAHNPAFKSLEANGLLSVGEDGKERVCIPIGIPLQRVQVKRKVKVTVKEGESAERGIKDRGTLEEIVTFALSLGLPRSDGESCFHKWEGNGWTNGGEKIKDWKATIRSWKAAKYLPSQKSGNGTNPRTNGQTPKFTL